MKVLKQDKGFVLVTALLVMLVLTIIGIAATTNTSIELEIAANDRIHKNTFYEAEAGASLGTELLEQAFSCSTGFSPTGTMDEIDVADIEGNIRVYERNNNSLALWSNVQPTYTCSVAPTTADAAYPISNLTSGTQIGYLQFGGTTTTLPGGSLQMAAGYEGKGKSAAQGGTAKIFNIYSMFKGLKYSESVIAFGWRHLVGSEGDCNY